MGCSTHEEDSFFPRDIETIADPLYSALKRLGCTALASSDWKAICQLGEDTPAIAAALRGFESLADAVSVAELELACRVVSEEIDWVRHFDQENHESYYQPVYRGSHVQAGPVVWGTDLAEVAAATSSAAVIPGAWGLLSSDALHHHIVACGVRVFSSPHRLPPPEWAPAFPKAIVHRHPIDSVKYLCSKRSTALWLSDSRTISIQRAVYGGLEPERYSSIIRHAGASWPSVPARLKHTSSALKRQQHQSKEPHSTMGQFYTIFPEDILHILIEFLPSGSAVVGIAMTCQHWFDAAERNPRFDAELAESNWIPKAGESAVSCLTSHYTRAEALCMGHLEPQMLHQVHHTAGPCCDSPPMFAEELTVVNYHGKPVLPTYGCPNCRALVRLVSRNGFARPGARYVKTRFSPAAINPAGSQGSETMRVFIHDEDDVSADKTLWELRAVAQARSLLSNDRITGFGLPMRCPILPLCLNIRTTGSRIGMPTTSVLVEFVSLPSSATMPSVIPKGDMLDAMNFVVKGGTATRIGYEMPMAKGSSRKPADIIWSALERTLGSCFN